MNDLKITLLKERNIWKSREIKSFKPFEKNNGYCILVTYKDNTIFGNPPSGKLIGLRDLNQIYENHNLADIMECKSIAYEIGGFNEIYMSEEDCNRLIEILTGLMVANEMDK